MRTRLIGSLILVLGTLCLPTRGQAFLFPCDSNVATVPTGAIQKFKAPIFATVPGSENVNISIETGLPAGWSAQYCQVSTGDCYVVDETINIDAGPFPDTVRVEFVTQAGVPGMGWMRLKVTKESDPTTVQYCTYTVYAGLPVPVANFEIDCSDNTRFFENEQVMEFFSPLTNTTNQPDSILIRMETVFPGSWFGQFCTVSDGICYLEDAVIALPASSEETIRTDFFMFGEEGEGQINLAFSSRKNPSLEQRCYYRVFNGDFATDAPDGGPGTALSVRVQPNPFLETTVLRLSSPEAVRGSLDIFGSDGRVVRSFPQVDFPTGQGQVSWDARDDRGLSVPAGIYYYRLNAPGARAGGMLIRVR